MLDAAKVDELSGLQTQAKFMSLKKLKKFISL